MDTRDYRQKWHDEDEALYKKPNVLQRAARGIASLVGAVNPYSTFALGRDFSHWDGPITAEMVKGLDFVVGKIGGSENDPHSAMGNPYPDETFSNNCQVAWNADVPFIGYWFIGARVWIENAWTKAMVYTKPDESHPVMRTYLPQLHAGAGWKAVYEVWWDWEDASDWTTYPGGIPAPWHTWTMDDMRARTASMPRNYPTAHEMKQAVYSRKSYVDKINATDKDQNFDTWMGNRPEIGVTAASWPRRIPITATAAEVRANWLPDASWKPYTFGYSAQRDKAWQYWQFSGDPDWVLFNGTPAELKARLGYVNHGVVVPPPVEPPPVVIPPAVTYLASIKPNITTLKLRTTPDATRTDNIIDKFFATTGATPSIPFEIAGPPIVIGDITWASLGKAYFAVKQGANVYADVMTK